MKEVTFDRAGAVEPSRLMQRVERWLSAHGYTVSTRTTGELQFVNPQSGPHRLVVRVDAVRTRFVFAPAAPGAVLPEAAELERRVDASMGAPAAPVVKVAAPAGQGGVRCSICATVVPAGESACPLCGMTL